MDAKAFRAEGGVVSTQQCSLTVDEWGEASQSKAALLSAGRAGDRAALDQLLARQERRVLAVCRGILGHADDAED
jgi:hypothetical protein